MAKTKADFIAQGQSDAAAGKPRTEHKAGTWQAQAYNQGYTQQMTVEQVKIATQIAKVAPTISKVWLDMQKRQEAQKAEAERRARLRDWKIPQVKSSKHAPVFISDNIRRAA